MRPHQHLDRTEAFGSLEFVARKLNLQAVRIAEVNRVHEATVPFNEFDATVTQARWRLRERGFRDVERDVLHAADFAWSISPRIVARLISKHSQQPPIARIEIQVVFFWPP